MPVTTRLDEWPLPELLSDPFEVPRGLLFRAGLHQTNVCFLTRGRIRLLAELPGCRAVRLIDLSAGSVFGLTPTLLDEPMSSAVVALESCQLRVISAGRLRELTRGNPDVAEWCMRSLALEVDRREATIATFGANALDRLHLHFAELLGEGSMKLSDGGLRLSVVPTHEELAQAVGVTCRYVSQLLKTSEQANGISRTNGRYIVPADTPAPKSANVCAASEPSRPEGSSGRHRERTASDTTTPQRTLPIRPSAARPRQAGRSRLTESSCSAGELSGLTECRTLGETPDGH